jgi:hypothetical protein
MASQRNALSTRLSIEKIHPEISIRSPLTSPSGLWELQMDSDDGPAFYDEFWELAHAIADRYPDVRGMVNDQ